MKLFSLRSFYTYLLFLLLFGIGWMIHIQHIHHLKPCALCMIQKLAVVFMVIPMMLLTLVEPLRDARTRWMHNIALLINLIGLSVAARQSWIEYMPKVHDYADYGCGAGLLFMWNHMDLKDFIVAILKGGDDCAKTTFYVHLWGRSWSLANMSLLFFSFIFLVLLVQHYRLFSKNVRYMRQR